jgi:alpha 1,2-mannosyltransferase
MPAGLTKRSFLTGKLWPSVVPTTQSSTLNATFNAALNPTQSTDQHPLSAQEGISDVSAKANATFVILVRNSELWEIVRSIRSVEDRFNREFHYDWVFLNDKPFDEEFVEITTSVVSGMSHYSQIPVEHWSFPDHIDLERAAQTRVDMQNVAYGDSESYRHMCRFESGFFFQQELMKNYEWYWRVEPGIELYCDITYDVFRFMIDHQKKYSFVISMHEFGETIETLWDAVQNFTAKHPEHIMDDNAMKFISDDDGETYNLCHMVMNQLLPLNSSTPFSDILQWSNFEIGSLEWLRSEPYTDFFTHLDQTGGFFYERWGDAPVHSIAASLMLQKDEIHFFNDIAYSHGAYTHCPKDHQFRVDHKCHCNPSSNFDWDGFSCE